MDTSKFISDFKSLENFHQKEIFKQIKEITLVSDYEQVLKIRGNELDSKCSECPHCESSNYIKFGKLRTGIRRYYCQNCGTGFNEYTGTWINGLHNKDKIPEFLKTIELEYSLKKTSKKLACTRGTAFNWRHKFLSAVEQKEKTNFEGVTESDEIHFLHSQKGEKCKHREPRKRGGGHQRGIHNELATVITVMDRKGNSEFKFSTMGRISKDDIQNTIGERVTERTILCTDGHSSYKAFTKVKNIEHHILIATKGKRVDGIYHIQHINSLHSYLRDFLDFDLRGISTKYLQKYLNWKKIKNMFDDRYDWVKSVLSFSLRQTKADVIFENIEKKYLEIVSTTQFQT